MKKEEAYHDYLKIKEMIGLNLSRKCRILSEYLGSYHNSWRIVGITEDALKVFSKNEFKYKSKMGINRSHIVERNQTYGEFTCDEFWNIFIENDKTILSTSSENMSKNNSRIIEINSNDKQFRASGYTWRHTKEETSILKSLYEKEILNLTD